MRELSIQDKKSERVRAESDQPGEEPNAASQKARRTEEKRKIRKPKMRSWGSGNLWNMEIKNRIRDLCR